MKLKVLSVALLAATAMTGQSLAAEMVMKIGTVVSGDHPENVGAREIKRLVEERSNGDIEVACSRIASLETSGKWSSSYAPAHWK